jgi:hypothetical protein
MSSEAEGRVKLAYSHHAGHEIGQSTVPAEASVGDNGPRPAFFVSGIAVVGRHR